MSRTSTNGRVNLGLLNSSGVLQPISHGDLFSYQTEVEDAENARSAYFWTQGGGGVPLTSVKPPGAGFALELLLTILMGNADNSVKYVLSLPLSGILRVPLVGSRVRAYVQSFPLFFWNNVPGGGNGGISWDAFNGPPQAQEIAPWQPGNFNVPPFWVASYLGNHDAHASDRFAKPTRRLRGTAIHGQTFKAPIAFGASMVRILTDGTTGVTAQFDVSAIQIPIGTVEPTDILTEETTIDIVNANVATDAKFEIVYYFGL